MPSQSASVAALLMMGLSLAGGAAADEERRPIYASLYGGGSEYDVDFSFSRDLNLDLEDSGNTFGLGLAYEINSNWFVQLDWTRTDDDDVEIDQVFVSLNYQMPLFISGMKGMVGVVAGEGRLEWSSQPDFADAIFDDLEDDETLFGIQLGLNYDLGRHWSTSLTYQYFEQEFDTNLEVPDEGLLEFEHSSHHYLLFGIRYHL